MSKNIIIKSSYSRLPDNSFKSNLGDLVRCAIITACIDDDYIWLTDGKGFMILKRFVDAKKLHLLEFFEFQSVEPKTKIFNLDNFAPKGFTLKHYSLDWRGFVPDERGEIIAANADIASLEPYRKLVSDKSYQQSLIEGLGFRWEEQDYPLPKIEFTEIYDIGFNWNVHPEWKSKKWAEDNWIALAEELRSDFTISWQEGLKDFEQYLNWMASCRLIVTHDSFGMHLASALRKKTVALVGATESREYPYDRLHFIRPAARDCMPCNTPDCAEGETCTNEITPAEVARVVKSILKR